MKAQKILNLIGLLLAALATLTSTFNLNAQQAIGGGGGGNINVSASIGALTVEKIWDPGTRLLVPKARVPFIQVAVTSGTTEPLQHLRLDRFGTAEFTKVFTRIVAIDGSSRIVASSEGGILYAEPIFLYFREAVLLAQEPLLLTIAGETKDSAALQSEAGKTVGLKISEVHVGNTTNPTSTVYPSDLTGATHTVNASLQIGNITSIQRASQSRNNTIGANRELGMMRVNVSLVEDIRCLPSFKVHSNGKVPHVQNLRLVFVQDTKVKQVQLLRNSMAPDGTSAAFETEEYITLPKGGLDFFFQGDIAHGFSSGGTIAVSATPADWRYCAGAVYGYDIPVRGFGTVVGATITVRGPRLDVSTKSPPYSWVGAGQKDLTVLTVVLDARESSEDIRVTEMPFWIVTAPQWKRDVPRVGFFDGGTDIPGTGGFYGGISSDWSSAYSESYPSGIVIKGGTLKEIQLRIDLASAASGYYGFGILDTGNLRAVGVGTGSTPTINLRPGWHIIHASQGKG